MNRLLCFILTLTMFVSLMPTNVIAVDNFKTYTYSDYVIEYNITNEWENNQNVSITVKNIGAEPIENWMLAYDFCGEINGIWNAFVETDDYGNEYIKNAGYNNVIEADETVNFGYTLNNSMYKPKIVHAG